MTKDGLFAQFGNICIALNHNTHPIELDILASAAPANVAVNIASHPRAMEKTLKRLASNSCSDVRAAVGENQNTPVDVLWKLAQDHDPDVRYSLAENHNLAKDILHALTVDENPYVAVRAQRTLERLAAAACSAAESACFAVMETAAVSVCA